MKFENIDPDLYGEALRDYYGGQRNAALSVWSDCAATEKWPISLFFRSYDKMPELEHIALSNCSGRILDIGAGAGSHSLWLQEQGHDVMAIDLSKGAVETMQRRGIRNVQCLDFFRYAPDRTFDTLLLLMNGIGVAATIDHLPIFFAQIRRLLSTNGKVLLDSSDIKYLFEENGEVMLNLNSNYYGEVSYRYRYKGKNGNTFGWLFIDFDTLSMYASQAGIICKKLYEDKHYHYLAELTNK